MNNTPNISGTNGKLLNVTEEELAKHNKKTDCWTAISGKSKKNFLSIEIKIFLFRKCL
jgi:cytochrome b involved in lipid metabolism